MGINSVICKFRSNILILFFFFTTIANCQDNKEIPMMHRVNSFNTSVISEKGPRRKPEIQWKYEMNKPVFQPIVTDKLIIVANKQKLDFKKPDSQSMISVIKRENQKKIWGFSQTQGTLPGIPVLRNNKIYFGTIEGTIYCLDIQTGKQEWKININEEITTPITVFEDRIYCGTKKENIFSLDIATQKSWRLHIPSKKREDPEIGNLWAAPAVNKKYIAVSATGDAVYVVDKLKKKIIWKKSIKYLYMYMLPLTSRVAISNDKVYFIRDFYNIECLKIDKGQKVWEKTFENKLLTNFCIDNNNMYITNGNEIIALQANNGNLKWENKLDQELANPIIGKKRIYVGSSGCFLYSFDRKTGKKVWKNKVSKRIYEPPTIYKHRIFIANIDGELFCLK